MEQGVRPIVLERGADVDERRAILSAISRNGIVDPDTNYSFGEGGAGAYSDGKLYTRSKKRGPIEKVLSTFVNHGANSDILVDAHPHIGSDKLPGVIKAMRNTIIEHGGKVLFHKRVKDLLITDGEVRGVQCADGSVFHGSVILATGHSARDTYSMLHTSGIPLQAKGLAIGVRLEHPQKLIDRIQYHNTQGRGEWLPAAEYSFVEQSTGRGVYSFCMCPGGVIVPAATAPGQLVVNGMSASSRSSRWANSGIVVEVHPGDIPGYSDRGALEMMALQEDLEHIFFMASGNSLKAPAQRMDDFCRKRISA
ncbi:MAG: FAD-dependent oxidoreductase, partial [Lachnospiraceae bacterium]|nr:FAD-dependent oxidoreductase [Lachnospiraceae bacterium]